jgi:3-oxoadipate enol-lactonase
MFAETRDKIKIAYDLSGKADAPHRIALTHSLAMDRSFWAPVVERLSGEASILTWDCRGHGQSDKPHQAYTAEQFADDLADLFDHVGWKDAIVAGASMGGCITLAFAGQHPQRVSGVGLFDTTAWYGADAPAAWEERAGKALTEGLKGLIAFQKTRWFGDAFREANPAVVDHCIDVFLRNDLQAYASTCRMLGNADLRHHLAGIKAPTRVLVGEEDYATPIPMAQALHDGIAGSTFRIVKGARHLSPLEVPDEVSAELRALVKG